VHSACPAKSDTAPNAPPGGARKLANVDLRQVKGGKEATVYCCAAHPATGQDLLAAKVYRPRIFRQLRNDARYRQGRQILGGTAKVVRDHRHLRAVRKGTRSCAGTSRYGQEPAPGCSPCA